MVGGGRQRPVFALKKARGIGRNFGRHIGRHVGGHLGDTRTQLDDRGPNMNVGSESHDG
jgi:hypothetical protein